MLEEIKKDLENIFNDRSVPRNIRAKIEDILVVLDNKKDLNVKKMSVIQVLDEVSNDTNIPMYTRTQIWEIVSKIENL